MIINICNVKFKDMELRASYTEKFRGYIARKYIDNNILHNHDNDKYIYRYPLIQYKIINKIPMILGINEGADIAAQIGINDDEFILEGKKFNSFQKEINKFDCEFGIANDYVEYKIKSPWIPLNQNNICKYNNSNDIEKEEMLKRILIGNIISMSKGMNYTVEKKINVWINLKEIEVTLKGIRHVAFLGNIKINFNIPDYFGIGKSVSRGFGTLKRVTHK